MKTRQRRWVAWRVEARAGRGVPVKRRSFVTFMTPPRFDHHHTAITGYGNEREIAAHCLKGEAVIVCAWRSAAADKSAQEVDGTASSCGLRGTGVAR